jgi:hypothetical protein
MMGTIMSMNGPICRAQYQLVLDRRQVNFNTHFATAELAAKHQLAHQRLLEVETVYKSVGDRRESKLFELASQLLGDALSQLACANYRLAFFCLRSFLEMSIAAIRFSAYEFELREWEASRRDVSWNTLSSDDTGCFSVNFVGAFFPQLKGESKHYQSLAKRAYREASEYVHGNPKSHGLAHELDATRADHWFELLDGASTAAIFCFLSRYLYDIPAERLSGDLIEIIQSEIGHFAAVKDALEELESHG